MKNNKDENVIAGAIGGLIFGFFIFFIMCIALFCGITTIVAQVGMGAFIAFGYMKYSKSLSGKGILICSIIVTIYSHIIFKVHLAFLMMKAAVEMPDSKGPVGFFEAYASVDELKEMFESSGRMSDYYGMWFKICVTTLIFGILGVILVYSRKKEESNLIINTKRS